MPTVSLRDQNSGGVRYRTVLFSDRVSVAMTELHDQSAFLSCPLKIGIGASHAERGPVCGAEGRPGSADIVRAKR
jgi:hypothetical protein